MNEREHAWNAFVMAADPQTRRDRYQEYLNAAAADGTYQGATCACGIAWKDHFPIGPQGCDYFQTPEEFAAEFAYD